MGLAFWGAFGAVRLHGYVRIQMVQRAIRLFAALPSTLIHPLDFFIATTGPLVLLRAWDRHEGIHLGERVRVLRRLAEPKGTGTSVLNRKKKSPTWPGRGPAVAAAPAAETAVPGELYGPLGNPCGCPAYCCGQC